MEFETGRRSTLARLQLSVQGLAGSLNSAKKVLVASTVLTAAFCGAVFGLTLVANEASKETHVSDGTLIATDGQSVYTSTTKTYTDINTMTATEIATQDFVSFSQDGADRYMQILGVQTTVSKKVINTIVGAFEVTEEGLTFAGDNVVLEATEADKAARNAQCKFCKNGQGRNAKCAICANGQGRNVFSVAGRSDMCAVCGNGQGRNFQCTVCKSGQGRNTQCAVCGNSRSNQCAICANGQGRNQQCAVCGNGQGRSFKCVFCDNGQGRSAAQCGGDFPIQTGYSSGAKDGEFPKGKGKGPYMPNLSDGEFSDATPWDADQGGVTFDGILTSTVSMAGVMPYPGVPNYTCDIAAMKTGTCYGQ